MNNTTGHAHDATAWLQLARRLQKQQLQQLSQLGELAGSGTWITGERFNSNVSDTSLKAWIDSLE